MADKDDFTFDDSEDFPETDLSSAFEESEHQAPEEPEPPKPAKGGGSKSRPLLLVLLLVIVVAGGAYYFMGLGGIDTVVTKAPAKVQKTVSLPPKPANAPAPEPAAKPVESKPEVATAAVPSPPPVKEASKPETPVEKPAVAKPEAGPKIGTSTEAQGKLEAAATESKKVEEQQPVVKEEAKVSAPPAPKPEVAVVAPAPVAVSPPVAAGPYALDAGSYLFASNSKNLEKKIRALGYEPMVTPVDAKVTMTRLRLGVFAEAEAKEALAYAKELAPSSFTLPKGDQYVLYAGTYYNEQNVNLLQERFLLEGIMAEKEPVEVVRTLSRVRFGSFPSSEVATKAAAEAAASGVASKVVKN